MSKNQTYNVDEINLFIFKKAILRFAYNDNSLEHGHSNDASYAQVLTHIDQLAPSLQSISDVVSVVQAGFIGTWGEWYYADPSFYNGTPSEETRDFSKFKAVADRLLNALPLDRMIQLRTPAYKIDLYQTGTGSAGALQISEAYNGGVQARIGHHNDCFVSSPDDYGTYIDIPNEYPYLEQDTRFLPMGGETCAPFNNGAREDCSSVSGGQADVELDRFHWSYLNLDWYLNTLQDWQNQTASPPLYGSCYEDVQRRLGYRFELQSGTYSPTTLEAGCPLDVSIALKNKGYAAPFNPRGVELVLIHVLTSETHVIPLPAQDPRYWFKESELAAIDITETAIIPASASPGDYRLYLHLPDPEPALYGDPDFSIRLANTNVWNAAAGYNDLKQIVTVTDGNPCSENILLSPVVYLQGAYDPVPGLMRDNLRAAAMLPLSEPYSALGYVHIGGGGESMSQTALNVSGANAITDWVFLELRDKSDPSIVQATRSALLQRDGDVVDVDGVSPVIFAGLPSDDYYLVVKHRNHLGVMSAAPLPFSNTTTVVDFTSDINKTFGAANGIAEMPTGVLGLFSGDYDHNGQVQNTDYNAMLITVGASGYLSGDFDLNSQVQNTDLQLNLVPNIGKGRPFAE